MVELTTELDNNANPSVQAPWPKQALSSRRHVGFTMGRMFNCQHNLL